MYSKVSQKTGLGFYLQKYQIRKHFFTIQQKKTWWSNALLGFTRNHLHETWWEKAWHFAILRRLEDVVTPLPSPSFPARNPRQNFTATLVKNLHSFLTNIAKYLKADDCDQEERGAGGGDHEQPEERAAPPALRRLR
jgi:hypothetical protein